MLPTGALPYYFDEIGIVYGRFDDLVLKSLYQPLYAIRPGRLVPFGVEALAAAYRDGTMIETGRLFASVDDDDLRRLERLFRAIHVLNYDNIGDDGLVLFFNAHPDLAPEEVEDFSLLIEEAGLPGQRVVCEVMEHEAAGDGALLDLARRMRAIGAGIAVDDFGAGHSTLQRVRLLRPEVVKIDAPWFRKAAAAPEALPELVRLFSALHDLGCTVLVEGIETVHDLAVAVDAGADYLQGFLLGRPAPGGSIFDNASIDLDRLLGRRRTAAGG